MSSAVRRSKPFIRQLKDGDVKRLAHKMRKEDVEEIFHASRVSPRDAIYRGIKHSRELFTVEFDGDVVAMFGVVGIPGQAGAPWMLATDALKTIRKSFLRECRPVVEAWLNEYHYLTNAVWSQNTVHIEWLKWLGFQFDGSDVRNGQTFLHFHRRNHV